MPESPYLLIPHIGQGQFQKEVTANQAVNLLERAIAEEADLDVAGTGALTITDVVAVSASIRLTGELTGARTLTIPPRDKFYHVNNATTGAFEIDIKTDSGVAVRVQQGQRTWILCDGVDCFDLSRELLDKLTNVSATYTAQVYDRTIVGDTSGAGFTITLPSPTVGKTLFIFQESATNTLTIARAGSDTINGAATSLTLDTQWTGYLLVGESASTWIAVLLSPTAGGGGGGGSDTDPKSSIYPVFVVGTNDDEFDNESFTGWTTVEDASPNITVTELNDCCSILHPGGDAAAELHALMKTVTPATDDYIETVVRGQGLNQGFNTCGIIMADGNTYGAGAQVAWYYDFNSQVFGRQAFTNYSVAGAVATFATATQRASDIFLRLVYLGSNNWRGLTSADGVTWIDMTGSFAATLSPTHIGFFVTTWGGVAPHNFSFRYFKHAS